MKDNDIIKALEWCEQFENNVVICGKYGEKYTYTLQMTQIIKQVLNDYNRKDEQINGLIAGQETLQKHIAEKDAEIERLIADRKELLQDIHTYHDSKIDGIKRAKSEAIKKFAERFKKEALKHKIFPLNSCVDFDDIDNLAKELTEPKIDTSVSLIDGHIDGKEFWNDTH